MNPPQTSKSSKTCRCYLCDGLIAQGELVVWLWAALKRGKVQKTHPDCAWYHYAYLAEYVGGRRRQRAQVRRKQLEAMFPKFRQRVVGIQAGRPVFADRVNGPK